MDITQFRQQNPQYDDMPDEELTGALHRKYYNDIPLEQFSESFGVKPKTLTQQVVDGINSRPAYEMAGSAAGAIVGGIGGSAVPVLGTSAGAVVGGGLGAGAGGQLYDLLHPQQNDESLLSNTLENTKKAMTDIAVETGMGIAVPKALQVGVDVGKKIFSPVTKGITKRITGLNQAIGANTLEDVATMERAGLKPDASLLDNAGAQDLGQSLRTTLGSSKKMQEVDAYNYMKSQELVDLAAETFGKSTTPGEAGKVLKSEAKRKKGKFFDLADKLYDRAYSYLPERFEVPNLQQHLAEKLDELNASETSKLMSSEAISLFETIQKDIADGTSSAATINSFKKLAKKAFEKSSDMRTDSDRALIEMRNVYETDIENAVNKYGDFDASKALEKAKTWWKLGVGDEKTGTKGYLKRYEDILKQEENAGAYTYATTNILNKKGGTERLKSIFAATPSAKPEIQAQVLRDLGGGENFSYLKFVSNYQKMAPETRELLFGKAGQAFKDLQRVSEMAASLEKKKNFSNTAKVNYWNNLFKPMSQGILFGTLSGGSGVGGAALGAGLVGAGAIKNNVLANLYTSPKFVKWLADTGSRVLVKPEQMAPQLTRLALMSTQWPKEEAEAVMEYINGTGFSTEVTRDKNGKIKGVKIKEK